MPIDSKSGSTTPPADASPPTERYIPRRPSRSGRDWDRLGRELLACTTLAAIILAFFAWLVFLPAVGTLYVFGVVS